MDKNIVLLNIRLVEFNIFTPWESQKINKISCSGFPIMFRGKPHIITNAHCVENALDIKARIPEQTEQYELNLEILALECDLAVLSCKNSKFWQQLQIFELGDVPEIGEEIRVYGYALGDPAVSYTRGHVNRYVLARYNNVASGITMQIDAVVNPGNSGGPVLNSENKLVGVIFSGIVDHGISGIEFVVPVFVIKFLEKNPHMIKNSQLLGLSGINMPVQSSNNSRIREYLGLKPDEHGVFVSEQRDILQSVENKKAKVFINDNGEVLLEDILKFSGLENTELTPRVYFPFQFLFSFADYREKIKFNYRKKSNYVKPDFYLSPVYLEKKWYVVLGMVFIENTWITQNELQVPDGINPGESLVLIELIPNNITDDIIEAPLVLDYIFVDKKKYLIRSMEDLHNILKMKGKWFSFAFHTGHIVPLKAEDLKYSMKLSKNFGITPHYKF